MVRNYKAKLKEQIANGETYVQDLLDRFEENILRACYSLWKHQISYVQTTLPLTRLTLMWLKS